VYTGYRVFPGGKELPERDADPSPPSSAVGNERVELYLYPPTGRTACTEPQCLYKGCTLPFFTSVWNWLYVTLLGSRILSCTPVIVCNRVPALPYVSLTRGTVNLTVLNPYLANVENMVSS